MASLSSIRNKLEAKVFSKIGSTVVLSALTSESTDKWGDATPTYAAGTNVTAVPYDYVVDRLNYQPFGDLREGEVVMIFKYDQALDTDDKITYNSVDYQVLEVEDFPYNDGILARAARMVKMQN